MKEIKFIGVIHMPPLLGYTQFPGYDVAIKNALDDLQSYQDGGVDAVIIENNYDIPHKEYLDPEQIVAFGRILAEVKKEAKVPLGVSVLWNDYKSALSLAVTYNCDFIRVPVFVDTVKTEFGVMQPVFNELASFKKSVGAENIEVLADIHVKHSIVLSTHTLVQSAKLAMENGANGVIITGSWTGSSPDVSDVVDIHTLDSSIPIYLGSGITRENINQYADYIAGVIVSTSLKDDSVVKHMQNIKPYSTRIDVQKVKTLKNEIQLLTKKS